MKRISMIICFMMLITSSLAYGQVEDIIFKDLNENAWYYSDVKELVGLKRINGYPDGSFRPKGEISLGEFLKISISTITGKDYKAKDKEHWAMGFYREAIYLGVIDSLGFQKNDLDKPINREDMAYILIGINENIQGYKKVDTKGTKEEIGDFNDILLERQEGVLQAYKKGLINGKDGKFQPKASTSRAEAVTVVLRLLNINK